MSATASDLSSRARELVEEGNARRLVIQHEGRVLVSLPLTIAAIIGAVAVLVAPVLAVLGAIAALLARVQARIEGEG